MHYLYYFSYPASPIATIDLNMLPLFYGCCTNKFVVMQARYSPLCSFHLLHLDPRRFCPLHFSQWRCISDGPQLNIHTWSGVIYISNQGSSKKKARHSLQPELNPTWPPGRIFLSKPSPICDRARLNQFFMYNF